MNNLCIGILAGFITAGLLYILSIVFKNTVTPWLRSLFYQGPDLSGSWRGYEKDSDDAEHVSNVKIIQKGSDVTLVIERFKRRSDHSSCHRVLKYKGKFYSGTLITLYEDVNMKNLIIGAMVLNLSTNNRILSGKVMYFDKNRGKVVAPNYFLKRDT